MKAGHRTLSLLAGILALAALSATSASAAPAPAPAWDVLSVATPSNFAPGDGTRDYFYEAIVQNRGGAVSDGSPIEIVDTLPAGVEVEKVQLELGAGGLANYAPSACEVGQDGAISTVTCTLEESLPDLDRITEPARLFPGEALRLAVYVSVPPTAAGPLVNKVEAQGGGAPLASASFENEASADPAAPGFQFFRSRLLEPDGSVASAAGSHPRQYSTSFAINTNYAPPGGISPLEPAGGDLKDVEVALPPGLAGDPTAIPRCSAQQFNTSHGFFTPGGNNLPYNECPEGSAVGYIVLHQYEGFGQILPLPIYNLTPPPGMPAQFGFQLFTVPIYIDTELRSEDDYRIVAQVRNTSEARRVTAATVTFWGTPAAAEHDRLRGRCLDTAGPFSWNNCPANVLSSEPFFRLPTSCASPLSTEISFDTWVDPSLRHSLTDSSPAPSACEQPPFEPTIEARPTTNVADAPSGLHVDLHIPQPSDPEGIAAADLKDTSVTLPPGLVVNPSSADGLDSCAPAQIGYTGIGNGTPRFSRAPVQCPAASKLGTVEVTTPLLEDPLPGAVYLASQGNNPFDSLLALYIAVDDPRSGVVVKLAARVSPDPASGQLTTTVLQSPQLPFEDFELDFFQGARASLRTPQTCGVHTTTTSLTPWSAPASGPPAAPADSFAIATSPSGGECPTSQAALPHAPSFEAGTTDPLAGAYSPFVLRLRRQDGSQELSGLNATLPSGLLAKLAGVGECSEAQIAQAKSREVPGQGALEKASSSCPASSLLGTVTVGAGAGPSPYHVTGNAYLAGPYRGAPLSMVIVTPALAGPFDLGTVVVRAALQVDRETALVSAKSDPIPTILQGIPLDVRSIAVKLDRSQFTLNPTSCDPKAIVAEAISTQGRAAPLSNRFQVGGCSNLAFKPRLSLRLQGGTKRGSFPALTAKLRMPSGGANIGFAEVALPHSEFLAQAHIRTICTRVQFAADACPAGAVYGKATAISPLLDEPLRGPVYLRASNNPLPDLVADLRGKIDVALVGRIDSFKGGIRTRFQNVPDAPVSSFVLQMRGGKKGLLENSRNLCRATNRATVRFSGQNGKVRALRPALKAKCGKKGKGRRAGR